MALDIDAERKKEYFILLTSKQTFHNNLLFIKSGIIESLDNERKFLIFSETEQPEVRELAGRQLALDCNYAKKIVTFKNTDQKTIEMAFRTLVDNAVKYGNYKEVLAFSKQKLNAERVGWVPPADNRPSLGFANNRGSQAGESQAIEIEIPEKIRTHANNNVRKAIEKAISVFANQALGSSPDGYAELALISSNKEMPEIYRSRADEILNLLKKIAEKKEAVAQCEKQFDHSNLKFWQLIEKHRRKKDLRIKTKEFNTAKKTLMKIIR